MSHKLVADSLKVVLSDTYALYLKTQNYHWNVVGPNFKTLHLLFEEQYTDLAEAVDLIAERIRALGEKAPGTWQAYEKLTNIKAGNENADAMTMVKDLAEDQKILLSTLHNTLALAQEQQDEVSIGMMVDRMGVHEKAAWMLTSSMG